MEKTLMLGKIEGRRRRGREDEMVGRHHRLNTSLNKLQELVIDREAWRCYSPLGRKEQTRLNDFLALFLRKNNGGMYY